MADAFATLTTPRSGIYNFVRLLPRATRTSDTWQPIDPSSPNKTSFLSIFDVSHTDTSELTSLFETGGQHESNSEVKAELQALPAQKTGTFRFYVGEDTGAMTEFEEHVLSVLQNTSGAKRYPLYGLPSFTSLRSQWISPPSSVAWLSTCYGMGDLADPMLLRLPTEPSFWFLAKLMRFSKSIHVAKDDGGCLLVFITVLAETVDMDRIIPNRLSKAGLDAQSRPKREDIHLYLAQFCNSLKREITTESFKELWKSTNTHDVLVQLVLMGLCRGNLADLSHFIDALQIFRTLLLESVTDPRRTMISLSSTQDIVRDAYFYEELRGCVSDLNSASSILIELLSINFRNSSRTSFDYLAVDTRAICSDLKKSSDRLCTRLDQHVSLFQLLRSFKESQGVWILGLLASVFLPLSLATGLLSMQTRLVDLHLIFYDFCGVIILIGTLVLVIIGLLNVYVRLNEQLLRWRTDPTFRRWIYPSIGVGVLVCCIITWGLLLSSFLVGMVKSVGLGLKILGYGAAAIGGVVLLTGLGTSAIATKRAF
ncbi:hypothetical protein HBH70_020990 [Parastagonospora nodorum]|nr:hypothetical protein HBH52_079060 [Parastagonospora nodorum]KAH4069191.1 hypothetical protein HBH50_110010 [Parastagonospora nodorum]KAH4088261.1 hypothetical protein HBH48_126980 [Parastagonospora nodorum]KAH5149996.1 hypothetical protein HBH70_020990 [Parastagonospora nodorum]KAH5201470.1 hypothetical protein HBH68_120660 [Parastagonospora nodorum]